MAEVKKESAKKISYQEDEVVKKAKKAPKKKVAKPKEVKPKTLICPQCNKGQVLKGKTAYGCSEWKSGCSFKILFSNMDQEFNSKTINELVLQQWKAKNIAK